MPVRLERGVDRGDLRQAVLRIGRRIGGDVVMEDEDVHGDGTRSNADSRTQRIRSSYGMFA